ncbi:uncharacterized protein FFB20_12759 [Fusarium fujikuroi]|nr:uncharacterized protein FFC1_09355 [Fusarium fujikuroi]SCO07043.1 uncharacterized protein FFB20_12759 [Fusarium fujikuroi]SCO22060.1 uncharacterized protein FFE2_15128 [Fusarium fujikuroi]SCO35614.1 uncharacterized protein FFNC_04630 [Fusarium fujikuroi]SCV49985.1 uncharacterized protein FFFS_09284 [Fusarium fujikuroi]
MEFSTVPSPELDFIRELHPAIAVRHKTRQCKRILAEFGIASVNGVDAKGGSKSDDNSDNKFDTTGFLHDTSLFCYEGCDGFTYMVCQPSFKPPSFGYWVQMEVKVTESETGDSEDITYYPVGEVWIGHEKGKPDNPYKLCGDSSSPRTGESTLSYNGLNPDFCQTITKPLKEGTYDFNMALAPALSYPQNWHSGQRYSVVINTVFKELERMRVVLREACHSLHTKDFRFQEYKWLPRNETIWYVRGSEYEIMRRTGYTLAFAGNFLSLRPSLLMHQSPTSYTNEARCVTSLISDTTKVLGYSNGKYRKKWVAFNSIDYDKGAELGGFPPEIIGQYGYTTVIRNPKQLP